MPDAKPSSVDELYGLPLAEFTSARNALAKEAGDPAIRELRKPSVAAWTVNQLARRREVDVRRLIRAGEQLEAAQRDAFSGGDPKSFQAARRDERNAVRKLRSEAAALLRADGHLASDATLERVAKTLHAAAATADGRTTLREGRLTEELEPTGFESLAGLAPAPRRTRAKSAPAPKPKRVDASRVRKAREAARVARTAADAAEQEARAAERAAERARRDAERAAARAVQLEAKLAELEAPPT